MLCSRGQVGIAGHLRIGMAAQIGAQSGVMTNIPAGQKYGGTPARPAKQHFREVATLSKLASRHETGQKSRSGLSRRDARSVLARIRR